MRAGLMVSPTIPLVMSELIVDLSAIADNWRCLDKYVGSSTHCGAVVKANAYGLGLEAVAKVLFSAGCTTFFVATLAEGKALREYLTPLSRSSEAPRIFVLGGFSYDVTSGTCSSDWLEFQLIPVLFSKEQVRRWANYCSRQECLMSSAIKVDTGMHRLGIQPEELDQLIVEMTFSSANPVLLMSHLACADEPSHPLNQKQIDCFSRCIAQVKEVVPAIQCSLCNSAGIFLSNDLFFDVVRPGVALYGANSCLAKEIVMQPVIQLRLAVMQLKTIAKGESVGYGAEFVAQRETRIAIVFGGYADGLLRSLGNLDYAFYAGKKVPLIGRVSMDSMVFDVTDIANEDAQCPSFVELFAEGQTIDHVAQAAGTIAHEILAALGERYQRRYIGEKS
jgi:alanine racemase